MGVTWIIQVINNTEASVYIKNTCTTNVGKFTGKKGSFTLDDHRYHELLAGERYSVDSCGIPWEGSGKIIFTMNYSEGWEIYTSGDNIKFEDMKTGKVDRSEHIPQGTVTVAATESGGKFAVNIS